MDWGNFQHPGNVFVSLWVMMREKKLFKNVLTLIMVCTLLSGVSAQSVQHGFINPVDIEPLLSGNFGELRSGHFHSGIDIKTNGHEGMKVHAAASGEVVRINVSPWGYGNALYIKHDNGYTTVYGHLQQFAPDIARWVEQQQYARQSFAVQLYPHKGQFEVEQGQLIALSGNSGGSGGPHLHFEIRETQNQKPVNPLAFNMPVKDFTRPRITGIKVYPAHEQAAVCGLNRPFRLKVAGWGEQHRIESRQPVLVNGPFYIGVAGYDQQSGSNNKNGVYEMRVYLDSALMFHTRQDGFLFSQTRYVNCLIDYVSYIEEKQRYQVTWVAPNNRLPIYQGVKNRGIMRLSDTLIHNIEVVMADIEGNEARVGFSVKRGNGAWRTPLAAVPAGRYYRPVDDIRIDSGAMQLHIPPGALYDSLLLDIASIPAVQPAFSRVWRVHHDGVPLQKNVVLSVTPDSLPVDMQDKAFLARRSTRGEWVYAGGKYTKGVVTVKTRYFGDYKVQIDTIPPHVEPINVYDGLNVQAMKDIRWHIRDEMSGIQSYRAMVNGKWYLVAWDPKKERLTGTVDEHLPHGDFTLTLEVVDNMNNVMYKTVRLKRE